MRKIRELARTVQAINRDFLETKYLIRAVICNIVSPRIRNIVTENKTDNKSEADSDSDSDSDEESTAEAQSVRHPQRTDVVNINRHLAGSRRYTGRYPSKPPREQLLVVRNSI